MQNITRKTLAVLLSVLLLCAMLPLAVVSAAGDVINKEFEDGNVFFSSDCALEVVQNGGAVGLTYSDKITIDLSEKKATLRFDNPSRSVNSVVLQLKIGSYLSNY